MQNKAAVSSYLLSLGIKPSSKGYRYLSDLIMMSLEGKEILPLKYQNCISKAWLDGDIDALYGEFGNTIDTDKGKPTAKQFIMQIAEKISVKRM